MGGSAPVSRAAWAPEGPRMWWRRALTCILTAITTEMSSFSSSLKTTSFFKVRLHNLQRAQGSSAGPSTPRAPPQVSQEGRSHRPALCMRQAPRLPGP